MVPLLERYFGGSLGRPPDGSAVSGDTRPPDRCRGNENENPNSTVDFEIMVSLPLSVMREMRRLQMEGFPPGTPLELDASRMPGQLSNMLSMKLMVWNCRGAGSENFLRNLGELVRRHGPAVLVLLETRVPSLRADRIRQRTGYNRVTQVEAVGFSGGIWMFWREDLVEVEVLPPSSQSISVIIRRPRERDWLFSAIYASPNLTNREELCEYMRGVSQAHNLPWLVAGDWNEVANAGEKQGGAPVRQNRCRKFTQCIDDCELIDMGFSGPRYTWVNSQQGHRIIRERLDRALCNIAWREKFPEAWVEHLPPPTEAQRPPFPEDSNPWSPELSYPSSRAYTAGTWFPELGGHPL